MIVTNIETYPGGAPIEGAAVLVHLVATTSGAGAGYAEDLTIIGETKTVTDEDGAWSLDLVPQDDIIPPGTVYVVEVHPDRGANIRHTISVPATGGPWWVGDILAATPSALPIPTSAAAVSFTPTGTISATNVQAAIAELDTDDAAELAAAVAAHNASGAAHPGTFVLVHAGEVWVADQTGYSATPGADNTAAVQAAIDSGAGTIRYPRGTTTVGKLTLKANQVHKGCGPNNFFNNTLGVASVLKLKAATNDHMFFASSTNLSPSIVFEDLELDGNQANQTVGASSTGIYLTDVSAGSAHDVWVKTNRCYIHDFAQDGFYQGINRRACTLDHTYLMSNARFGAFINGSDSNLYKCDVGLNISSGIYVNSAATRIIGCDSFRNANGIVFDAGATRCMVVGTVTDLNNLSGVQLTGGAGDIVIASHLFASNSQTTNDGAPHLNVGTSSFAVALIGSMFTHDTQYANKASYDIVVASGVVVTEVGGQRTTSSVNGHVNDSTRLQADSTGGIGRTRFANGLTLADSLLFGTDNTYDIGAAGATRPRDLHLGRTLNVAGSLLFTTDNTTDIGAAAATRPRDLHVARNIVLRTSASVPASPTYAATRDWAKPTAALVENVPRLGSPLSDQTPLTSGTLRLIPICLPKGITVTSISFLSGTTALNGGQNQWFTLHDSSRVLLGVTADDTSTAWAANTVKSLTVGTPFVTTYDGLHFIGIMVKASTAVPSLIGMTASSIANALTPVIGGNSNTGQTTPPTIPFTANAPSAAGVLAWCYVS